MFSCLCKKHCFLHQTSFLAEKDNKPFTFDSFFLKNKVFKSKKNFLRTSKEQAIKRLLEK
jgi:hypothetical protein